MNAKEISKMSNDELLTRFANLCHIIGEKTIIAENIDDEDYKDKLAMGIEIRDRMGMLMTNYI